MFLDVLSFLRRRCSRRLPIFHGLSFFGCRNRTAGNVRRAAANMNESLVSPEAAREVGLERTFRAGVDYARFVLDHHVLSEVVATSEFCSAHVAMKVG